MQPVQYYKLAHAIIGLSLLDYTLKHVKGADFNKKNVQKHSYGFVTLYNVDYGLSLLWPFLLYKLAIKIARWVR